MSIRETTTVTNRKEPFPEGRSDVTLFQHFSSGRVPRGSRLEVTSPTIPLKDGRGAEVVLIQSVAHVYPGLRPDIEHLVFSDDDRVKIMTLRRLTHWRVTGKVSEEELEKRGAEMALDKHGS